LGARKSSEVQQAVALVIKGECSVWTAAERLKVAPSSIYRDPAYRAWAEKQKAQA
jgi:hypothetical protein